MNWWKSCKEAGSEYISLCRFETVLIILKCWWSNIRDFLDFVVVFFQCWSFGKSTTCSSLWKLISFEQDCEIVTHHRLSKPRLLVFFPKHCHKTVLVRKISQSYAKRVNPQEMIHWENMICMFLRMQYVYSERIEWGENCICATQLENNLLFYMILYFTLITEQVASRRLEERDFIVLWASLWTWLERADHKLVFN